MARVIVLGGCGAVGRVAATTLDQSGGFEEVIIADLSGKAVRALAATLGPSVSGVALDVTDEPALRRAVRRADVVLNCVGPFYKTVRRILSVVIDEGVDYVDVCDDVDATLEILELDEVAKAAGVRALIGMGSSPGVTNILARFAAETLLDETEAVDIFHAHGGEPVEGAGVIGHRFHCMSIPIPMFLEGCIQYVDYFGADGIALRQVFDFPMIGDDIPLYPYPHPEQVTLPRHLSLKQVTNKGTVLPNEYYELTRDLCQLGLASREPVEVGGESIVPHDFAVAYIQRERDRILEAQAFGQQRGCVSVLVRGTRAGEPTEYRFHLASRTQALGEGTGIPAAVGAILMGTGRIEGAGVFPPEAGLKPMDFLEVIPRLVKVDSEGGGGFQGVRVERVDAQGTVTEMNLFT